MFRHLTNGEQGRRGDAGADSDERDVLAEELNVGVGAVSGQLCSEHCDRAQDLDSSWDMFDGNLLGSCGEEVLCLLLGSSFFDLSLDRAWQDFFFLNFHVKDSLFFSNLIN